MLRRPVLGRLTLARFCADIARMTHQAMWTFFVAYQFAWNTAQVGIAMAAGALAGAAFQARAIGAGTQSWISRATGADERGTVNGALTSTSAIAEMAVPVTAGAVFAWSLTCSLPGVVFVGAALFAAASTLLLATTRP